MSRPGGADDVTAGEVYANGIALDVVRGWLGATASDLDWDTFNDADDVDATRPRPERRASRMSTAAWAAASAQVSSPSPRFDPFVSSTLPA